MNLPYRLLAVDLDGTMLSSRNTLSEGNCRALNRACAAGVFVVPTTGRLYAGLPKELERIPGIRYCICSNGAVLYDKQTHTVLQRLCMPAQAAADALSLLVSHGGCADVYLDGHAYTSAERYRNPLAHHVQPEHLETFLRSRTPVEDLLTFVREKDQPVEKLFSIFEDPAERQRCWDILTKDPRFMVTTSHRSVIEVNDRRATKGEGLRVLSVLLHIPQAAVMAAGDGLNDLSMIEWAGLGVAMENAEPAVKKQADVITAPCDEDGLAKAIDRWIFSN